MRTGLSVARRFALVVAVTVLALLAPNTSARAATATDVEVVLAQKINQGRAVQSRAALVTHAGLRTIARNWSSSMASTNNLSHGNPGSRINGAAPDPAESNGAPDDGFAGWCENVAWNSLSQSASADQVAQMFYNQWFNSTSGHKECMLSLGSRNFGQNVVGVGVVYDSADGRWWATLDVVKDNTPPRTWTRFEQTSSTVSWWGTWSTNSSAPNSSGGSHRYSSTTGSYARFTFSGSGVRWIGHKSTNGGNADIRLDGLLVSTVDQYASSTLYQRVLFERTGLGSGTHTLEVRVKGTKNASSTSYRTWVDAFERRS